MKLNKKGSSTIFTGIMIFLLSVVVMITVLLFVVPYFNGLNEQIRYKQNKENIWRYRALASDYYIFKHEYILIFKK